VGSRWAIEDDPRTALMMVMFHEFLCAGHGPAQALRLTQTWMLDEAREIPASVSPELCRLAMEKNMADPVIWAAFTAQGR
jgi:CHAT domain-containing protein